MRRALTTLVLLLVAACADAPDSVEIEFSRPETAVAYDVTLEGAPRDSLKDLMERALELYRRQERGAESIAFLRRRAESDLDAIRKIMRSDGWYEADAKFEIAPPPAPAEDAPEGETPKALVKIVIEPGRRYTLTRHSFLLVETGAGQPPAPPEAGALGSPVGDVARADRILDAESAAVEGFRAAGRPYAKRLGRDAVADPEAATIEVDTTIATGPALVFGEVRYEGLKDVEARYLDTYLPFKPGETASPDKLVELQRALSGTNLFEAAAASFPDDAPAGPEVPVTVRLEEAPFRTVSAGLLYSTDAGPAVTGGFEHRNLWGENETLTIDGVVGLEEQSLENRLRFPQWRRPGQDLVFGLDLRHIDDDAFEEFGGTLSAGVERKLSPQLTVGYGGLLELSRLDEGPGDPAETSRLVGLPLFAAWDGTDDKLDPSKGFRARATATPFSGIVGGTPAAFLILDNSASVYFDLTGEKRYILAARGRLGSILAGDFDVVSANRRLYSGGGGSVRGYAERFIGPLDANRDPTGGLSVAELGAELRARVTSDIGLAGFVEAGTVSEELFPAFDEGVQVAVGGGLRYFSPIGPLRLDVGVPVNPRKADDSFQVYISLGQAF